MGPLTQQRRGDGNLRDVEDIYELSPLQHGMLYDSLAAHSSGMYAVQLEYFLTGSLNFPAFERAWQMAAAHHPVLRTSFHWEEIAKPLQVVHRKVEMPIARHDLRGLAADEQDRRIAAFLEEDRARGVDFQAAPLMRIQVFETGDRSQRMVWSFHHVVLEGWSASLVLADVQAAYRAIVRGQSVEFEPRRPYRDYIGWLQQQNRTKAEQVWREELRGFRRPTPLGIGRRHQPLRALITDYDGIEIRLPADITAALEGLSRRNQLTLNTIVQGGWALVLSRYSGLEDVLFGAIVAGRSISLDGVESMVGLCTNVLPTRVEVTAGEELLPWLKRIQARQAALREYEYLPLVDIKAWSEVPKGMPLFETLLVFQNWSGDLTLQWDQDLAVTHVDGHHGSPGSPLSIIVTPGAELTLAIAYDKHRFRPEIIGRALSHLATVLGGFAANPARKVRDIALLPAAERQQILAISRGPRLDSAGPLVQRMFEAQVERTPEAVAAIFEDRQMTYRELNARANQLARHLRKLGVGPQTQVGLCLERDLSLIAGVLGVLKAGAAYVPLDPEYPRERLRFMIENARAPVVLTQTKLAGRLPDHGALVVAIDSDWDRIAQEPAGNLEGCAAGDDLAYIIYTSGSTGTPKGVMIQHRSLANYIGHVVDAFAMEPGDRLLQFSSISFDTAAEEIYTPLVRGATLVLRNDEMIGSVPRFLEACRDWKVTVLDLPTAYWHVLVEGVASGGLEFPPCVRLVIIGGERADPQRLVEWSQLGRRPKLINTYGPTESTIAATICDLGDWEPAGDGLEEAPIGAAVSNSDAYVLDDRLDLVPLEVSGELCLGGRGLAVGYLDRPDLTAERFVPNPFSDEPGARLYRTGDWVRRLADGNLEFLGRIDHQVKFRGYRIELKEIGTNLAAHPAVSAAVAMLREDAPGQQRLVGYVVLRANEAAPADLREFLQQKLPAYMVPSAFVSLDTLPLTINRKVDLAALPAPGLEELDEPESFVAPRTPVEIDIAEIWREVLGVPRVGVYDNFFDLGGHSLMLMQVQVKMEKKLGVRLSPGDLVYPTLGQLAAVCEERLRNAQPSPSPSLLGRLMTSARNVISPGRGEPA